MEVSSPSTRRLELIQKRKFSERFGAPEYWYVDLDADRVEVYRLDDGVYRTPTLLDRGRKLETPQAPGFVLSAGELLGEPGP